MAFDFSKANGMGTDNVDRAVLGPPFINIIQKGSPEFDETHPKYKEKKIEGCRPGNILFEPERLILPQPVTVIPLAQTALYTEWKPNKGGYVCNRATSIIEDRMYRKGTPGGPDQYKEYLGQNELVYTITFMLLFQHGSEWKKGMIAFTATQLKHARNWSKTILNIRMEGLDIRAPIFAAKYNLTTVADSNAKGGWFGWQIANAGILSPEADQALLETAFEASKHAQLNLPKPQVAAALPSGEVEVVSDGNPY